MWRPTHVMKPSILSKIRCQYRNSRWWYVKKEGAVSLSFLGGEKGAYISCPFCGLDECPRLYQIKSWAMHVEMSQNGYILEGKFLFFAGIIQTQYVLTCLTLPNSCRWNRPRELHWMSFSKLELKEEPSLPFERSTDWNHLRYTFDTFLTVVLIFYSQEGCACSTVINAICLKEKNDSNYTSWSQSHWKYH